MADKDLAAQLAERDSDVMDAPVRVAEPTAEVSAPVRSPDELLLEIDRRYAAISAKNDDLERLDPETARQWARDDARDFREIPNGWYRENAAVAISENMVNGEYRQEFSRNYPEATEEIGTLATPVAERLAEKEALKARDWAIMAETLERHDKAASNPTQENKLDTTSKQREAELVVFSNFGRNYAAAMRSQEASNNTEDRKITAAAMVASASATAKLDPASINRLDAANGRAVLEKAYGSRSDDVAAVLTGRAAGYELPRSAGGTKDFAALAMKGQLLAQQATRESYAGRGILEQYGTRNDYLAKATGKEAETAEKLTSHMLHVRSSIAAAVDRKEFDQHQATALYKRFENTVFDNSQNGPAKNQDFANYEKTHMARLRESVSREVEKRYELQRPLVERVQRKEEQATNQAKTAEAVAQNRINHQAAIRENPNLQHHSSANIEKIAFYRALLADREKDSPAEKRDSTLGKFDNMMRDIKNVNSLPEPERSRDDHHHHHHHQQASHKQDDSHSL